MPASIGDCGQAYGLKKRLLIALVSPQLLAVSR